MEKINIAELLKDCPKGMEFDCLLCNSPIALEGVAGDGSTYPIRTVAKDGFHHVFTKYGTSYNHEDAKCVIFPKGRTTWEGFQRPFVEGDIVSTEHGIFIGIVKSTEDSHLCYTFCSINDKGDFFIDDDFLFSRLATEEEKAKLFQAIRDNGYRWNEETKTLEKVKPKFRVGDRIQGYGTHINHPIRVVKSLETDRYRLDNGSYVKFGDEHAYKLLKFDINNLVPFESRVLVRNDESQYWIPAFWGCKRADGYTTTFGWCKYCIPYDGNEHLLETNKDCDEHFKTWK